MSDNNSKFSQEQKDEISRMINNEVERKLDEINQKSSQKDQKEITKDWLETVNRADRANYSDGLGGQSK